EDREDGSRSHLHILRSEKDLASFDAIGDDATDQRKQEDRDAAEKLVQRQQESRVTEAVNQPALRHNLHPGTNAGSAGANPHQAEIAILKCLEDPADQSNPLWYLGSRVTDERNRETGSSVTQFVSFPVVSHAVGDFYGASSSG